MLREDGPCPLLEGPEQDEGLDPETKKQKIHQPTLVDTLGAFPLHGTVRFGTARYGTVRLTSGRLHFHRSLVPL